MSKYYLIYAVVHHAYAEKYVKHLRENLPDYIVLDTARKDVLTEY